MRLKYSRHFYFVWKKFGKHLGYYDNEKDAHKKYLQKLNEINNEKRNSTRNGI